MGKPYKKLQIITERNEIKPKKIPHIMFQN